MTLTARLLGRVHGFQLRTIARDAQGSYGDRAARLTQSKNQNVISFQRRCRQDVAAFGGGLSAHQREVTVDQYGDVRCARRDAGEIQH